MNNTVIKNSIDSSIIQEDFLDLEYKQQPLTKSSELDNWRSQGYTNDAFLGSMYGG